MGMKERRERKGRDGMGMKGRGRDGNERVKGEEGILFCHRVNNKGLLWKICSLRSQIPTEPGVRFHENTVGSPEPS